MSEAHAQRVCESRCNSRDPLLDVGQVERVQDVLRLEGEVGLEHEHGLRVGHPRHPTPHAIQVVDDERVRGAHVLGPETQGDG